MFLLPRFLFGWMCHAIRRVLLAIIRLLALLSCAERKSSQGLIISTTHDFIFDCPIGSNASFNSDVVRSINKRPLPFYKVTEYHEPCGLLSENERKSNLCSAHLTALNYILRKNCEETVMCSKILTENTNVDKQLLNFTGIRSFYAKAVSTASFYLWKDVLCYKKSATCNRQITSLASVRGEEKSIRTRSRSLIIWTTHDFIFDCPIGLNASFNSDVVTSTGTKHLLANDRILIDAVQAIFAIF
ncbi:uncharacterized protein [Acropora muricata]|uniref:uncharacterized protein n=1 Tax=Acropora muricata TaxID=159855 RepID=UPI0034E59A60